MDQAKPFPTEQATPPAIEGGGHPGPIAATTPLIEHLMPYGTVAKAHFVRVNGLPAYNRARGLPCTPDSPPG